jgi:hypothetical protein
MTTPSIDLEDDGAAAVQHTDDKKISTRDAIHSNGNTEIVALNDDSDISDTNRAHLTGQETWNIIFCFLAWACNVSIVTLGTCIWFN